MSQTAAIGFDSSRGHEVRRIVGRLAAAAAVTRLALQGGVGGDGVAGGAGVAGHRPVGVLVQAEPAESRRVVERQIHQAVRHREVPAKSDRFDERSRAAFSVPNNFWTRVGVASVGRSSAFRARIASVC